MADTENIPVSAILPAMTMKGSHAQGPNESLKLKSSN